MSTPDIPYATPTLEIVNSRGNEISFAVTAQSWNTYQAANPDGDALEDHVAVKYSSGQVIMPHYTPPDSTRIIDLQFAWNLGTSPGIISKQINYLVKQIAQTFFAQDMFSDFAFFIPIVWPSSYQYFVGGGPFGDGQAVARGPFRYIRSFSGDIYAFSDFIPAMYCLIGGGGLLP